MERLEQLKTIPTEAFTKEDIELLRLKGVINGVGGSNLPEWVRALMTQFGYYLDFETHDIDYWKLLFIEDEKEREERRKEIDIGLLKYSWIGPIRPIEKLEISGIIIKDLLNIVFSLVMFCLLLIPMFLSPFVYMAVRIGGKQAVEESLLLMNTKNDNNKK